MTKIINCHIHVFTEKSAPPGFPPFPLNFLSRFKPTRDILVWLLRNVWPFSSRDLPQRYANFINIAALETQAEILHRVRQRYPLDTQFVILPMDLRGLNRGNPKQSIREQHEELAELAKNNPNTVIPFIHIDPRSSSMFDGPDPIEFIREFHNKGFRGLKLYPPLGYKATDEIVMPIYKYAEEHHLPVMVHCSRGGVRAKNFTDQQVSQTTAPYLYREILPKFPDMKLCLAHFGGNQDWETYLEDPWLDDSTPLEEMNWLSQISTMIKSGEYPNLFTDISYTIFRFYRFVPILKVFLGDDKIRSHTLFGSDYYMIEQEEFLERELSMSLRAEIGEDWFRQIAHDNPQIYLS